MVRYNTNKRAYIIAALIILLCLICLAGSTLALFTNQGDGGKIGIVTTSGDFEIDIIDTSEEGKSLVGEVLQFQTSAEHREIYFEPGATFFTQGFKIKNDGNIPINFRIALSDKDDEEAIAEESLTMAEFLEAFDVWVSTSTSLDAEGERMPKFLGSLSADSVSTDTYYLFIRMKEDAGNDFQNKKYTGIGVTVYAVQGNVDIEE